MATDEREATLGERLAAARSEQGSRARLASSLTRFARSAAPASAHTNDGSSSKRRSKNAPREISSRRAVPLGRFRCLGLDGNGDERKAFDPRFEDHCGELREDHTDRNFAFVDGLREKERAELEEAVKRQPDDEELRARLRRVHSQTARRKADMRRKSILADARAREKEAVRQGKNPYFMKKSALRERELEAKFAELKQAGGVRKYIEKRRKRATAKDRRRLPSRRDDARRT